MKSNSIHTLLVISGLYLFFNDAHAELEEVVVTAEFRPTELQSLASSVSVISPEVVEMRAAVHLEEVANLLPNVNFSTGSSRARYFQIRGIGERSQFAEPINPSVGLLIDGVDFSGIGSGATLFDLQQIEVLRGPQGTLYGANALAGLIRIESHLPQREAGWRMQAQLADYSTRALGLALNQPLVAERLLSRLAVSHYRSDGFIDNRRLGRDDSNDRDELTARWRVRWMASDDLTLDMSLQHVDIDNGYDAFSLDNDRNTLSDEPGTDSQRTTALSLRAQWHQALAQTEVTLGFADSDLEYSYDEDWTFAGFHPFAYSSFDQYLRDRESVSAEVRWLSNPAGRLWNDHADWVAGFYYLARDESLQRNYTFAAGPFFSDYDTDNSAVYAQIDFALNGQWSLVSGARVEWWEAEYHDSNGISNRPDETLVGGKVGLTYQYNAEHLLYGHVSRGYKPGGTNNDGSLVGTDQPLSFDSEFQWHWEVGAKSNWCEDRLRTRVAAFYADREDQQVKSSILVPIPDTPGAVQFIDLIDNAASGKNYGFEAELDWQLSDRLLINASLGLLQAEFDRYDAPPSQANPDGLDLSGADQAHAPSWQFAAQAEYRFDEGWFLQVGLDGKDGFYFSDRHRAKSDAYTLFNARMGYQAANWSLSLWGRNLSDEAVETRGFGSFGNDPRDGYAVGRYTQLGEPRIVGLSFEMEY